MNKIGAISLQSSNNAKTVSALKEKGIEFKSEELYTKKANNHKFKIGQAVVLTGLENYPQFNGEVIIITAIREDGDYGKAYYFKTDNSKLSDNLNWTYEYRLKRKT